VKGIGFLDYKSAVKIFLVLGLLIHSAVENFASEVHYLNTGVFFLFYGLMFLLALPVIKNMFGTVRNNFFLYLLIIWTVASIFWTTNVLETSLAIVSLLGMLLFAFYLLEMFSLEEVFELFVYFCLFSIVISAIALYFYPELSIYHRDVHYGKWQGVYSHKNVFGFVVYFSIIVFSLALYFKSSVNKFVLFIGLLVSLLYLYQSESTTSLLATVVCFVLLVVKWLNAKKNIQWRWLFIVFFIGTLFVTLYDDQILELFGKNLTFSGRIWIWEKVLGVIQQKPFIGNGYYGYWNDAQHGVEGLSYRVTSHSGFLEIMVFLGIIGFCLFLLMWGRALFLSAKLYFSDRMTLEATFLFIFLISFSFQSTMESYFFQKMKFATIVFIYCILYLNRYFSKKRTRYG